MAPRADLTGQQVAGWTVLVKAPAQNRVPFWTATHDACGIVTDLPHVSLMKALAGKSDLPACTTCVPADERRAIDHGMHLACGTPHLLGVVCADGVQREPGATPVPAASPGAAQARAESSTPVPTLPAPPSWSLDEEIAPPPAAWALDGLDDSVTQVEIDAAEVRQLYYGHPSETRPALAAIEPADAIEAFVEGFASVEPEPAAHLADAATGALVVHGRVDRLEAPQDVLDVIRRAMHGQARNHQSEPGPSQMGGCERRLGYHLATGIGNGRTDDGAWRPQVGTAVHAWLDEVFANDDASREPGQPRWLSSYRVTNPVVGTIDIADLEQRKAIDFKITGKTTRDKAARGEVSDKYEVQLDLYALGLINDGYPIETVALLLLPASGSLSEAVWYERPVNLDRAREAVARRDRIKAMLSVADVERVLPVLSTTDDFCGSCPAFGTYCEGFALPAVTPALRMVGGAA